MQPPMRTVGSSSENLFTSAMFSFLPTDYRPSTKLQEGNVFMGVWLYTGGIFCSMFFPWGWVSLVSGPFREVCPGRWVLTPTGTWDLEYYGNGQQAGGTHPTGMLSCFVVFSDYWLLLIKRIISLITELGSCYLNFTEQESLSNSFKSSHHSLVYLAIWLRMQIVKAIAKI